MAAVADGSRCRMEACPRPVIVARVAFYWPARDFGMLCEAEQAFSIIHVVSSRARTTFESESHQQKDQVCLRTAQMLLLERRTHLFDRVEGKVPNTDLYGTGRCSQISLALSSTNGCLAS